MGVYKPVTLLGMEIAKVLTQDTAVSLEVLCILENWEASIKNIEEHPHHYNPEEAIRIVQSSYPLLFSKRFIISNMRQMKEKAEKYDAWMIDKTDGAIITIRQEKWQECLSALKKLEAIKELYYTCVPLHHLPPKLRKILEVAE